MVNVKLKNVSETLFYVRNTRNMRPKRQLWNLRICYNIYRYYFLYEFYSEFIEYESLSRVYYENVLHSIYI